MQAVATSAGNGNCSDEVYNAYLGRFAQRFAGAVGAGKPLFTTNAPDDLFQVYLDAFAPEHRQYHACSACRQFINRYGGLVTIDEEGNTETPLWFAEDAPEFYRAPIEALAKAVRRAKVTGVFLSSDKTWGMPLTGKWTHLSVPAPSVFKGRVLTAGQTMAEKREDFITLQRALTEFKLEQLEQALTLLDTEALYRSEKVRGPVQWLRDLYVKRDKQAAFRKLNVTWLAVATAPPGFCHPRSSMAGSLLEDIASGLDFADVSRKFAAKMHPLQYQRPQAGPNAQNIKRGEEIIAAMGAQRSLLRRFARLEEVEALWRPAAPVETPKPNGVFGHLKAKGEEAHAPMDIPATTMTWDKFQRTVLPTAQRIEFYAGHGRDNYTALVTAVDMEAPPLLQWDMPERRNPVSWYVWHGGSAPNEFSLAAGAWHKVNAVSLKPCFWHGVKAAHQGHGLVLVLEGARDTRSGAGVALFPECLKTEYHAIRSTIEAYSKSAELEGREEASACGLMLDAGNKQWNALVRVTSAGRTVPYRLDRWD